MTLGTFCGAVCQEGDIYPDRRDSAKRYYRFGYPLREQMTQTNEGAGLHALLQPLGGLFSSAVSFRAQSAEPRLQTRFVQLGDLSQVGVPAIKTVRAQDHKASVSGAGTGLGEKEAKLLALAEGLERYCTCLNKTEQFILATAKDLGADALDLDTIPKCSSAELSHSTCPLSIPNKNVPLRWVRGISLHDGRLLYVPVVMVYLYAGFITVTERISLPITTGCAAHNSYEHAMLNAILEIVERDAVALVWLQKLCLPRIEIDHFPSSLEAYWARYQRSSGDLEYIFFDATTDIGIPTVYGVQIAPDKRLTTLVSCSTDLNPAVAVAKTIRDMTALRLAFLNPKPSPAHWDEFSDVLHGAGYMAGAEHLDAFDFLFQSGSRRFLSEIPAFGGTSVVESLQLVLARLRQRDLGAYAVDLSTDEALRSGMRVVRVLIPGLQPLTFHYRARYLGHPRLYDAPKQMGYPVLREDQLNHWPQPFA
jgi:ribosomal protein S12 methylthiotransferase accessory factor